MTQEIIQEEMPFAMVRGEAVTEPPKDLYIPPEAMEVFLDTFEGPLDLLLYLIRKQNLDILDIPVAEIYCQDRNLKMRTKKTLAPYWFAGYRSMSAIDRLPWTSKNFPAWAESCTWPTLIEIM
jgi:hypothetical protein